MKYFRESHNSRVYEPMINRIFLALFILLFSSTILAESAPSAEALSKLDGYALGLTDAEQFSGVVLVAHEGKVIFHKAYGLRDEQSEDAITLETRFDLASGGKMFTAVAVLQQIAAGKLRLDSTVGEVLKNYPNREFASTVTVRQLLTHTAGAGDADLFGAESAGFRDAVKTVSGMVALHSKRAPEFKPGSQQKYGNFGHVVLGQMIEVLSGLDYETYVRERVFAPAGMRNTAFTDCATRGQDTAIGYVNVAGKRLTNCATLPIRGFPAGGQVSTTGDMLRFVDALQSGKLLPPELLSEAIRPHKEYMGLGFFATGYGPGIPERDFRWGHAGDADGICTDIRTYPLTGETLIVLSNRNAPSCFAVINFLHKQLTP